MKDSEGKNGSTEFDLSEKSINPMGGFKRYGILTEDFIMITYRPRTNQKKHHIEKEFSATDL